MASLESLKLNDHSTLQMIYLLTTIIIPNVTVDDINGVFTPFISSTVTFVISSLH